MTITLREIDKENYRAIAKLSHTLTPQEQTYVAHNAISILDAQYHGSHVRGVYADDTPVGLVMWGWEEDVKQWWIIRLMTAKAHQGKGYGRTVMQQVIDSVRDQGGESLYISFVPQNEVAKKLYQSMGFVDTGRMDDDEVVYKLMLKGSPDVA